tara:strand:- start:1720 stop:2355 length:636 start_codon:yes stop_codon:yes gene_type:complete
MPRDVTLQGLYQEALRLLQSPRRHFVAISGAPGSGKSTTAEDLAARLEADHPVAVAVLPMDGYHFDDAVLHARGRRPWKGAPDTFDVGGLAATLQRLQARDEDAVAVPVFDRDLEISRGSARLITSAAQLIIVEGNYLLLDQAPWDRLAPFFDMTVMLDVPEPVLAARLRGRWTSFNLTEAQIVQKLEANDLPNGRTVRAHSRAADLVLHQ